LSRISSAVWSTPTDGDPGSRCRSKPGSTRSTREPSVAATPQPLGRQLGEPALDQVEPGAVGRGKCSWNRGGRPASAGSPGLGGRGVPTAHLHLQLGRHRLVDTDKEPLELDRWVPRGHLGDDQAPGQVQGRVQVGGVMAGGVVAAPLGLAGSSGSTGAVRSSAWSWDCSSTHSTTAASGGLRYSPPMSRTLQMNCGALDSFQLWTRCGLSPTPARCG
jgi:hypothetical protein